MKKLVFVLLFCCFASPLFAQQTDLHPFKEDRWRVEFGMFWVSRDFKLGADGQSPNDEIDFNETFGLSRTEPTYFFQIGWRFSKRWTVSLQSFGVSAEDGLELDRDVEFEDVIFKKGTFVEGGVSLDLYRLFFSRNILDRPKHDLAVGIGIHGLNIGAFLEGELLTSEGDREFDRRGVDGLIPLPNIGVSYEWYPHKRWMIGADVDWFGLTIEQYSGGLWNVSPRVKFQIIEHFGVGLDYRIFDLNAKVDGENWSGKFNMSFSGPLLTLHGNF